MPEIPPAGSTASGIYVCYCIAHVLIERGDRNILKGTRIVGISW